jgi:hypothetical protein
MAFHAGFSGERAERTWASRIRILKELSFIDLKSGPSGPLSYALIFNPYLVVKHHWASKHPGITEADWNGLRARMLEVGAIDLASVP